MDYEKYLSDNEKEGVKIFAGKVKQLLGPSLIELRIFGSKVRGDFDMESDIDILLVVESEDWHVRGEIINIVTEVNMEYNSNISPVIYTKREHDMNKYYKTLFVQDVEREGVLLA